MTGRGRPLRFLALVFATWVGARILLLWPQAVPLVEAADRPVLLGRAPVFAVTEPRPLHFLMRRPVETVRARPLPRLQPPYVRHPRGVTPPLANAMRVEAAIPSGAGTSAIPVAPPQVLPPFPTPADARRWRASLWLAARGDRGIGAVAGGQIGGAQAGARIAWSIDTPRRIAVIARLTTPLRGRGQEGALGVEWQPVARIPVRLVAEHRIALDSGKHAPGVGVLGGVDAHPVLRGFALEAYGQAGALRRARLEPYADGAARVTRALGPLRAGVGLWGAAQRDAARLDIGPSITATLPIGDRHARLLLDWRQRVAGDARPGSGLALTLAADF